MKKLLLLGGILFTSTFANAQYGLDEGFDDCFALYTSGGWFSLNRSNPNNSNIWYQDAGNFTAFSGAANSSITAGWYCTDNSGVGDASVWLFTPPVYLANGDTISFYTISYNNSTYADRMELRLNTTTTDTFVGTTSTSVGNYTTLLLTINPTLDNVSYPETWTKYTTIVSGITPGNGRIAFRYDVTNTGGSGTNGSVVGIDDFHFRSAVLGTNELKEEAGFNLYPSPVSDFLNIEVDIIVSSYSIITVSGQSVIQENSFSKRIDVTSLPKGMYLIKLQGEQGVMTRQFIKS